MSATIDSYSEPPNAGFPGFAQRLRNGDNDAADELLNRYARRLRAIATRRLGSLLKAKVDPDDVLQSVLANFFSSLRKGNVDLESSRELRSLLAIMVVRKCARYAEIFSSAGRNAVLELSTASVYCNDAHPALCLSRESYPEATVIEADALEHWLQSFDSQDRQVIEGILAGDSTCEIAERLSCSQRTVQRTLQRVFRALGVTKA